MIRRTSASRAGTSAVDYTIRAMNAVADSAKQVLADSGTHRGPRPMHRTASGVWVCPICDRNIPHQPTRKDS